MGGHARKLHIGTDPPAVDSEAGAVRNWGSCDALGTAATPYFDVVNDTSYISQVPVVDMSTLQKMFNIARDDRFLTDPAQDHRAANLRRIPWRYPYDGCWLRSELSKRRIQSRAAELGRDVVPFKIFAFGGLAFKSPFSLPSNYTEYVDAAYHTANIVRAREQDGEPGLYVIDPMLNPQGPLPLWDWITNLLASGTRPMRCVRLCGPHAFKPSSKCRGPTEEQHDGFDERVADLLSMEWQNMIELNNDPVRELGDHPTWK